MKIQLGGPLIRKSDDAQIGLVSYGGSCDAPKGLPGVYTRTSQYYQWIERKISKNN
jgi:secreted trypsin-like serine protease